MYNVCVVPTVIPSFGSGVGQFGSLGVSWNTAVPQQLASSIDSAPQAPPTKAVATPTDSTHHEDDLGKWTCFNDVMLQTLLLFVVVAV